MNPSTHVLTHGAFSESLPPKSNTTHDRKGREGKGMGTEGRKAPCIVKVVDAKAGDTGSDHTSPDRLDAWLAPLAVGAIS